MPWPYHVLTVTLGLLPDLDVIAFSFGIPYGSRFGHRGISHSLFLAVLIGWLASLAAGAGFGVSCWSLLPALAAAAAGHSLLDALTDGGMGVALFAPFDDRRYFFPWRP